MKPTTGARPGAAFPVPDGVGLPLVKPPPPLVVVPPLASPPPPVVIVPSVVVGVPAPELSVVLGDPPAAPPVTVVVSWSEAVGRSAETVTLCAAVDADGLYEEAVVKPQVLIMSFRSRKNM